MVGGKSRHVVSYLAEFLFPPHSLRGLVKSLSGGERNRLLLARLFTQEANLLVLDEPTNDLDIETLELLEGLLAEYAGTLLLVSHDRAFLDGVVTSLYAFEGQGRIREYVGGYSDWQQTRQARTSPPSKARPAASPAPPLTARLTYTEQRELEGLPAHIDTLETELARLHSSLEDAELFHRDAGAFQTIMARLPVLETAIQTAYNRWDDLERRQRESK